MKKKDIFLGALALVMVLSAGLGSAWAYFTTYAEAVGGYTIELGDKTEIHEKFSDWTKRVVITSEPDSQPVYIRAKAFCGSAYDLEYSGEGWELGEDGYYYYREIVNGGENTSELQVLIKNVPQDAKVGDNFNIVVVYESTPVRYRDGEPYADWDAVLDAGQAEGGTE